MTHYRSYNRGTSNYKHKLNEEMVKEIKRLIGTGMKQKEIAKQFSVNPSTISKINNHMAWTNVKDY